MNNQQKNARKKVFVAMSGGVDSSVSAGLLKEQGFDITGVFIKIWSPEWLSCTSLQDRADALQVAVHLSIPFLTLDLSEEYKQGVVDYMIEEYGKGRTPNPDVMCNKVIKFGAFFDWAIARGAEAIATGHYAEINPSNVSEHSALLQSADTDKDQTYFLWTLRQHEISRLLFPIGGFTKTRVREIADRMQIPVASKKDSQGLCFMGNTDMKSFLMQYLPQKQGSVLNTEGEQIGHHDGAHFYTIGQRHGFVITRKTVNTPPYYVFSKDMAQNTITVAHRGDKDVRQEKASCMDAGENLKIENTNYSIGLRDVNWINKAPRDEEWLFGRLRHRGALLPCFVRAQDENKCIVYLDASCLDLVSGQSIVLYKGGECLGGGVVE